MEALHFFHSNHLEQKLKFHLHKISISTACESAHAYTPTSSTINQLEQKLKFHFHKISISTACESALAYTNFFRHHNLPKRLQIFHLHGKSGIQTASFG